jgi:hypothetical protein
MSRMDTNTACAVLIDVVDYLIRHEDSRAQLSPHEPHWIIVDRYASISTVPRSHYRP